jgi:hypothetical protein
VAVEFAVDETLDAVRAVKNSREIAATRRSDQPIEDDKCALYGRIDQRLPTAFTQQVKQWLLTKK